MVNFQIFVYQKQKNPHLNAEFFYNVKTIKVKVSYDLRQFL